MMMMIHFGSLRIATEECEVPWNLGGGGVPHFFLLPGRHS